MTTKVPVELSSTPGIADSSNATAITIDSSENTTFSGDVEIGTTAPKINLKNTDTSIIADQSLGVIEIESSDGSTGSAGTIAKLDIAASGAFDGSGHGSQYRFSTGATNQSGSIALTEQMRLSDVGNLHLSGGSDRRIQLGSGGAGANQVSNNTVHIRGDGANMKFMAASGGAYQYEINGTEAMRIASDGTLFHNRTSDFYMSDSMASKNLVLDGGTGANDLTIVSGKLSASTMYHIGFFNSNSHVGNISTNGYATSYTTSSDYRHKENVNYEWRGLEKINNLKPAQFNFINETEIQEGFLAHEAQEVTPYAVVGEKDGETKQTMDYGRITPILVKAIQEQQTQIEALQSEINLLKGE